MMCLDHRCMSRSELTTSCKIDTTRKQRSTFGQLPFEASDFSCTFHFRQASSAWLAAWVQQSNARLATGTPPSGTFSNVPALSPALKLLREEPFVKCPTEKQQRQLQMDNFGPCPVCMPPIFRRLYHTRETSEMSLQCGMI